MNFTSKERETLAWISSIENEILNLTNKIDEAMLPIAHRLTNIISSTPVLTIDDQNTLKAMIDTLPRGFWRSELRTALNTRLMTEYD